LPLLEVRNLAKRFGGLVAVHDLNLDVSEAEILGLIGPNGAGKTTVLSLVGGFLPPTKGKIVFKGEDITRLPPHRRARRGIARVFQRNVIFSSFTVLENVLVSFYLHTGKGLTEMFFKKPSTLHKGKITYEKAMDILQFVGLSQQADELAINLPHGYQRRLCLAIALATEPKLILLDEPVTGMNVQEVATMMAMTKELRDKKGITSVVVEHNMRALIGLCDRIVVLNYGKKIAEGSPKEIVENPVVIEAYLGVEEDDTGN
jgi:branched-chain amino acid transport system ATP-binding protein